MAAGAAVGLGFVAPLPAGAAPPPRPRLLAAAIADEGRSFTSQPVRLAHAVDLVGLTYDGPAGAAVALRASTDGHTWTPWYATEDSTDEGPDLDSPERAHRQVTQPVWTDKATFVQYRVSAPGEVRDLQVRAVDVKGHSESFTAKVLRAVRGAFRGPALPAAHAMPAQPAIVTRAQWGADESIRRANPVYGAVQLGLVHHTDTGNTYSPAEAPGVVRGIYAYHVQANGWNDIGYNFLVDRYGTIYEGRYGGMDKPVVGAHAEGFNSQSTGVSLIGTFQDASPTPQMLTSLEQVLAWKLDLAHVDPLGKVTLVSNGSSRYPQGAVVTLDDISGHRDVTLTDCPGNVGYTTLAAVRAAVATIGLPKFYLSLPSPSKITGSQAVGYGTTTITARSTEALDWTVVISHDVLGPVRHFSGAGPTMQLTWDGTDDGGHRLPGGSYTVTVNGSLAGQAARPGSLTVTIEDQTGTKPVIRLAGTDRYATAAAVSRQVAASATDVVIASGESGHLVDSLVAAPLAKATKAPLLLTSAAALPDATAAEVDRLHPTTAWVVGGPSSIGAGVVAALTARHIVVNRLAGDDAPSTAAAVATALGGVKLGAVLVSRDGRHLVDGLAASGPAAGLGWPVLLVDRDSVPPATVTALVTDVAVQVFAVGGQDVISDTTLLLTHATRVAGADRYATAAAVADATLAAGLAPDTLVLASGATTNLVDALSGGAFGKAVLLTAPSALPTVTWKAIYTAREAAKRLYVLGGTAAITDAPPAAAHDAINAA